MRRPVPRLRDVPARLLAHELAVLRALGEVESLVQVHTIEPQQALEDASKAHAVDPGRLAHVLAVKLIACNQARALVAADESAHEEPA